jgi:UDP-glucuronate 4-epimerase
MCHLFHSLHGLQVQCVRLFTVYGPRQRPDLAVSTFTSSIAAGRPVPLYGDGSAARDYTHVSDTVRGILAALDHASPWDVFNIGSGRTIATIDLIRSIEEAMGRRAVIEHLPPQPGDVPLTFADPDKSQAVLGYEARVPFEQGIREFVDWFRSTDAQCFG